MRIGLFVVGHSFFNRVFLERLYGSGESSFGDSNMGKKSFFKSIRVRDFFSKKLEVDFFLRTKSLLDFFYNGRTSHGRT